MGIITALLVAYLQPGGIAGEGGMDCFIGLWDFLCGRSVNRELLFDSQDYGATNRASSGGGYGFNLFLGYFALGGILGMIFGIPLTAFIIIAWRLLCRKYFNLSLCR